MTREDAIYWIKNLAVLSSEKDMPQIEEALNMAIEALEDRKTEPQKDCKKCKNYDRCKNNRWKCCVYEPKDEPQMGRSE